MANSKIRDAVFAEYIELTKLNYDTEVEMRMKYLQEIILKVDDYERYIREYNFKAKLQAFRNRGMEFSLIENTAKIKNKWDDIFTSHINHSEKEKVNYDKFRWHIFSCGVLGALENNNADNTFLDCKKTETYIFFQHSEECYKIENLNLIEENDLKNTPIHKYISDFYIFDVNEKWTYICTHELDFGPYFYQVK